MPFGLVGGLIPEAKVFEMDVMYLIVNEIWRG